MNTEPEKRLCSGSVSSAEASEAHTTHHGISAVQRIVHVRDDSARVRQRTGGAEAAEEARDGERLDVRRQRLADDEAHVAEEGEDEDGAAAEELGEGAPHDGPVLTVSAHVGSQL